MVREVSEGSRPLAAEEAEAGRGRPEEPALTLSWRNLDCHVGAQRSRSRSLLPLSSDAAQLKQVLCDCWGDALPGEILAVMGPSGAGKTTLLNKDIFFERLTVLEHLRCTAMLRLPPWWTAEAKQRELTRIVELLHLGRCLHTMVGSPTVRGLSGGELKRLNIATELLSHPKLVFLDEPLTGLDSTLAITVLDALQDIASNDNATVLLTVHQPSTPIWKTFDKFLLMAPGGYMAYSGGAAAAAPYFDSIGLPRLPSWSEQDHYIQLVSDERCGAVVSAFVARTTMPPPPLVGPDVAERPQPPFLLTVQVLLRRALKNVLQSYLKPLEWALTLLLAIVFGLLFWQVGPHLEEAPRNYVSIIFFFVAQWSWAPLFQVITNFPLEGNVLTRERASESYPISGWYTAKVLSELPLSWMLPAGFFFICYPMVGLPLSQAPVLFAITLLNVEVAGACGCAISASVFDSGRANTLAIVFMCFVMCSGGYFVNMLVLPVWLRWIRFTSFWYYILGLWIHFAIPDERDHAPNSTVSIALESYSFSRWSWDGRPEYDLLVLIGMDVLARGLSYGLILNSRQLKFR